MRWNPESGILTVRGMVEIGDQRPVLLDALGRRRAVRVESRDSSRGEWVLRPEHRLPRGAYLLSMVGGRSAAAFKFVVLR